MTAKKISAAKKPMLMFGLLIIPALAFALLNSTQAAAQSAPTSVPLLIPTLTPTVEIQVTALPSQTPSQAAASLGRVEANDAQIGANIRSAPDATSEKYGTIFPGQFYSVIGRYELWYQIQYDKSPNGKAWVFSGVVKLSGLDPKAIPTILPNAIPSPNSATGIAQSTAAVLVLTPGAQQTATILQASATGVTTLVPAGTDAANDNNVPLPTFTFPPPFVEATLPPRLPAGASQGGLPPIIPIIVLGGIGLFGLFVSALRRG